MSQGAERPSRDDELLLELLQRLDARPCLAATALEQAVAGTLSFAEAIDVHVHLRQCVACLSVFSRLHSLGETPVDVVSTPAPLPELLPGLSPAVTTLRDTVRRVLYSSATRERPPAILFAGETGTGKSFLARVIHRAGPRADGPFVEVNCGAIPESLLEAEIFGYEAGAFSGVHRSKPGLFQTAHRGTIFLDEVGLIPAGLQAKILRALESGKVFRVGGTRPEPIDVWLLTATSFDLTTAIRQQQFREDFYYRIATLTFLLPPLRERGEDVVMLAEHYLGRLCTEYGVPAKTLAADARAALIAYSWPGNVRELVSVIERAVILSSERVLTASMLGLADDDPAEEEVRSDTLVLRMGLSVGERADTFTPDQLTAALEEAGGNLIRAAGLLGVAPTALRQHLKRLGLLPDEP
jgi:transcriptional regulator with GAF, ATPase, and Fis domain